MQPPENFETAAQAMSETLTRSLEANASGWVAIRLSDGRSDGRYYPDHAQAQAAQAEPCAYVHLPDAPTPAPSAGLPVPIPVEVDECADYLRFSAELVGTGRTPIVHSRSGGLIGLPEAPYGSIYRKEERGRKTWQSLVRDMEMRCCVSQPGDGRMASTDGSTVYVSVREPWPPCEITYTWISEGADYRIGDPDIECRYPVIIGDDECIGWVFRWHGAWYANPAGSEEEQRVGDGSTGKDAAVYYLITEYTCGRITPTALTGGACDPAAFIGPVPLLHRRMPATPGNIETALRVMATAKEFRWRMVGPNGYAGSDNHGYWLCELCGWKGFRYWSHMRGRNGEPPSPQRHPGCLPKDQVRALVPAYQKKPTD
ncbi:hypothetical protein [Streptomyces smyrnaeus]|uniref:hypothetical protein n=1 Tax=Streptomyces smyrnaeus TaxID=1387713 RepID=UPI0033D9F415